MPFQDEPPAWHESWENKKSLAEAMEQVGLIETSRDLHCFHATPWRWDYLWRRHALGQSLLTEVEPAQDAKPMSQAEAATYLKVSPNTLSKWRSERQGPPYSKAGGVKYRKADLDAWVLENSVRPGGAT